MPILASVGASPSPSRKGGEGLSTSSLEVSWLCELKQGSEGYINNLLHRWSTGHGVRGSKAAGYSLPAG